MDQVLLDDIQTWKRKGTSLQDIMDAFHWIPPAPSPDFDMGWNVGGGWTMNGAITDAVVDITTMQRDTLPLGGLRYLRAWLTCSTAAAPPVSQWVQSLKWAAAGVKVIAVWNTQTSPLRTKAPTVDQVKAFFNGLPLPAQTGVWAFELVNEHDYSAYFSDTPAALAMIFNTAGPILRSKGYKVIGSNCLSSYGFYLDKGVKASLANVDFIGRHAYESTAVAALADYDKIKAYADQCGVGYMCTEVGLHSANWSVELPKLWAGLKQRQGTYIYFPLYNVPPAKGGPNCPYLSPGVRNTSVYDAMVPVLGT